MKKGKKRSIWMWLALVAVVLMLFGPTVFAGSDNSAAAAKGQYTWLPECLE